MKDKSPSKAAKTHRETNATPRKQFQTNRTTDKRESSRQQSARQSSYKVVVNDVETEHSSEKSPKLSFDHVEDATGSPTSKESIPSSNKVQSKSSKPS